MARRLTELSPAVLALVVAPVACGLDEPPAAGPPPEATAPPPAGVALTVGDVDVLAAEIAAVADCLEPIEPSYSTTHRLRLALTNVLLPRAAARALHRDEHDEAWRTATRAWELLAEGAEAEAVAAETGGALQAVEGSWTDLGVELWCLAADAEPGAWAPPAERIGRVALVRVDGRDDGENPYVARRGLTLLEFPYLPEGTSPKDVDAMLDGVSLTIHDPAYREVVPESWQYRMRGER